jgi:queuine tRNA-ribosyltransferase
LHHLFMAKEMLGPTLLSLHNVAFYCRLMADMRDAIAAGRLGELREARLARWEQSL